MAIENLMGDELTEKEMEIQVCIPNQPQEIQLCVPNLLNNKTNLGLVISAESPTSNATSEYGKLQPKDHSTFIYFSSGYMICMTYLFALLFNTKLKRTMADEGELDLKDILNDEETEGEKYDDKT